MNDVSNPSQHSRLDQLKQELEEYLRARFEGYDRAAFKDITILKAYAAYYKRFKKTYHVQHQLESVVLKNKSIPSVSALVEAMFMAELKNLLLTAGHDLDIAAPPITIEVAKGSESYLRLNRQEQQAKPDDMMIADAEGILSTIIYGPDRRTRIRPETNHVLYTVYAPPGIGEPIVHQHLEDIRENVRIIAPGASVEEFNVFEAT